MLRILPLVLLAGLVSGIVHAKGGASFSAGALGGGTRPLEVKGQNRSLAMLSAGGADKTKIGFVKPRKDYRPQILKTQY